MTFSRVSHCPLGVFWEPYQPSTLFLEDEQMRWGNGENRWHKFLQPWLNLTPSAGNLVLSELQSTFGVPRRRMESFRFRALSVTTALMLFNSRFHSCSTRCNIAWRLMPVCVTSTAAWDKTKWERCHSLSAKWAVTQMKDCVSHDHRSVVIATPLLAPADTSNWMLSFKH